MSWIRNLIELFPKVTNYMNNTTKCNRCRKILISEEYDSHLCTPYISGHRKLFIDYFVITKDDKGNTAILAKDMDGIIYTMIKCPSDESYQHDGEGKSDDKLTEPETAKHISLFFLVSLGVELRRELRPY
jgi:hypothetical protein